MPLATDESPLFSARSETAVPKSRNGLVAEANFADSFALSASILLPIARSFAVVWSTVRTTIESLVVLSATLAYLDRLIEPAVDLVVFHLPQLRRLPVEDGRERG
jgi:hypothetical protein